MVAKLDVNLKSLKESMQKIGSFGVKSHTFWGKRSDLFEQKVKEFRFYLPVCNDYLL